METFEREDWEESFGLFEKAAAKGHEESIWFLRVKKDVDMEKNALKEAFAKTEEPLGWYFAGRLSGWISRERFDFFKKSAEGGCSWGQVEYGGYFKHGRFVEKDEKVYVEWLEKAVNQNNPCAIYWLGYWFRDEGDLKMSYYHDTAKLGWRSVMDYFADLLRKGEGCAKDLKKAAIWSAKGGYSHVFWNVLNDVRKEPMEELGCDFNQHCYSLGRGLYWYQYGSEQWNEFDDQDQVFGNRCLDYYCSCIERQQKSIFTFLLCWNRRSAGVKDVGVMIAKMVWEGREDNLVKSFE
jgi:hypothetical protein